MLAGDQPSIADPQDDAAGVIAVPRQSDRVGVSAPDHFDRLGLLQLVEPLEGVAQLSGALEIERLARLLHPATQSRAHVERLPLEEEQDVVDHPAVLLAALKAHA